MASYNEKMYHVDNYDEVYKEADSYKNALSIQELYDTLGKYLEDGRLKPDEKLVVSANGYAGFACEFDFSNKGFPIVKDICG